MRLSGQKRRHLRGARPTASSLTLRALRTAGACLWGGLCLLRRGPRPRWRSKARAGARATPWEAQGLAEADLRGRRPDPGPGHDRRPEGELWTSRSACARSATFGVQPSRVQTHKPTGLTRAHASASRPGVAGRSAAPTSHPSRPQWSTASPRGLYHGAQGGVPLRHWGLQRRRCGGRACPTRPNGGGGWLVLSGAILPGGRTGRGCTWPSALGPSSRGSQTAGARARRSRLRAPEGLDATSPDWGRRGLSRRAEARGVPASPHRAVTGGRRGSLERPRATGGRRTALRGEGALPVAGRGSPRAVLAYPAASGHPNSPRRVSRVRACPGGACRHSPRPRSRLVSVSVFPS
ncbi:uncharacterized protein CMC5_047080 [Chondromyces crocatus]|uniref:Uncharacterized protein n=1 Tax=Chondromyces crocatus TaxID=52 RepID=A0A0K1EIP3_CHOCO|nr:uncharacterized protein CMC5_047080 [Chondromyces crocatus]